MQEVKKFVFRYNEDLTNQEEEIDLEGTIPIPRVHDLLYRKGKTWEVAQVLTPREPAIPIIQVFLKVPVSRRRL
jgi:hypothetical protein